MSETWRDVEHQKEGFLKTNGKPYGSNSPKKQQSFGSNASRRNQFIVLGSSGEALPITRKSLGQLSIYSSCNSQSTTDSFHSARDTIEEDIEGNY